MMLPHCWKPTLESCQSLCSRTDTIMLTWRLEVFIESFTDLCHIQIIQSGKKKQKYWHPRLLLFFFLFFLSVVSRADSFWWWRGKDRCSWQGTPDWGISASFHAAATSQPQSAEVVAWPTVPHCSQSAHQQDVCHQPSQNVCSTHNLAKKCKIHVFTGFLLFQVCYCTTVSSIFCDQVIYDCIVFLVWNFYFLFLFFGLQVIASDLQGNIEKLNNGVAFLIRHSQRLFKVRVIASSVWRGPLILYCLAFLWTVYSFKMQHVSLFLLCDFEKKNNNKRWELFVEALVSIKLIFSKQNTGRPD